MFPSTHLRRHLTEGPTSLQISTYSAAPFNHPESYKLISGFPLYRSGPVATNSTSALARASTLTASTSLSAWPVRAPAAKQLPQRQFIPGNGGEGGDELREGGEGRPVVSEIL